MDVSVNDTVQSVLTRVKK